MVRGVCFALGECFLKPQTHLCGAEIIFSKKTKQKKKAHIKWQPGLMHFHLAYHET